MYYLPGYCFSASLPPMLAAGALKALDLMLENPSMFTDIHERAHALHDAFDKIPGLLLVGHRSSVVKHLRLKKSYPTRAEDRVILNNIVLQVGMEIRNSGQFLGKCFVKIEVKIM